ncbi:MAG: DNA-binding protein [Sphaerospermopsis sp. SIO1G2]|nr:DNA-binding protein [Sphaerospermopsis sp. SIO1G1]NET70973.1 DNA-binding protein [Sphaerospermopsis sp. SIO1G2]
MQEYEFTLKFKLPNPDANPDMYINSLYESGCDDAIIGVGIRGFIGLNFIRQASSAYEAMSSAIKDVRKAIPQAELTEALPDLVGITDVAELIGCSRQNIQKLLSKSNSTFPVAVYVGSQSVWHLSEILTWLTKYKHYNIDQSLLEIAKTTRTINFTKESKNLDPEMQKQFQELVFN